MLAVSSRYGEQIGETAAWPEHRSAHIYNTQNISNIDHPYAGLYTAYWLGSNGR
jgi:hypothetical protein